MMTGSRWIRVFLILMVTPQLTVCLSSVIVGDGEDITLPCEHAQNSCDGARWTFMSRGKPHESVGDRDGDGDRRRVTEDCSLVIKNVTAVDSGRYDCRPIGSRVDSLVYLSAVKMSESSVDDGKELSCSVSAHEFRHTVKCLYEQLSASSDEPRCSLTVSASDLEQRPKYRESFTCQVTEGYFKRVQRFALGSRPSGGGDLTIPLSETTETGDREAEGAEPDRTLGRWLPVGVAFLLAALVATLYTASVAVVTRRRIKGSKRQTEEDSTVSVQGQRPNPAEPQSGPETGDTEDTVGVSSDHDHPEDGVCYTSVTFVKKSISSEDRVRGRTHDRRLLVSNSPQDASSSSGASSR